MTRRSGKAKQLPKNASAERKDQIREEAIAIAKADEKFRRRLLAEIRELGKGRRGGVHDAAQSVGNASYVDAVRDFLDPKGKRISKAKALEHLHEKGSGRFKNIEPDSMRKNLGNWRKNVPQDDTPPDPDPDDPESNKDSFPFS